MDNQISNRLVSSMSFFPSLSVVRTLPTFGHILAEEARDHSFTSLYKFRGSNRVKSGYMKKVAFSSPDQRFASFLYKLHFSVLSYIFLSLWI